jgi:hypothetical protein
MFRVSAHPGGHFRDESRESFSTWTCKDGKVFTGHFSMSRNDSLFIEGRDGKLFSLPLHRLSDNDRALANRIIKRHERLNDPKKFGYEEKRSFDITAFWLFIIASLLMLILAWFTAYKKKYQPQLQLSRLTQGIFIFLMCMIVIYACKKESSTPGSGGTTTIPRTSIGFLDSAFAAFKPAISTSSDAAYYYISSTGIPNHNMMIGITSWQQQVPIPQAYTGTNSWSIPLQPVYATVPLSTKTNLMKGAVAIAVNGIPIFNALNNRGEDSYAIGELDNWGGHCGRADDYHYHAAPLHLSALNGNKPIAFALDGFPVYGLNEADGSSMVALDSCHGHTIANGVYHYHGTNTYPYVVGAMKGKVSLDPATPAPENQILPQAFAKAVRPATTPLKGAVITAFAANGLNGYLLTYTIGTKSGTVRYSWDASNKFTYTLTDTAGVSNTMIYQR